MKYNKTFREALNEVRKIEEDGHTDVASAVRQSKTSIEDASQMLMKLQRMNPEDALPSWWMNKLAIAANNLNKLRDYLLVPSITNENLEEQDNPFKPDKVYSKDEVDKLKSQIQKLKLDLDQERQKAQNAVPNRDTGEIPLQTGIAHAILKIKDEKLKKEVQTKQGSKAISKLAKESLLGKSLGMIGESQASDKAKAMGLDYMSFGRYGKDGKVTHKSIGGQLTAVDKQGKPIKDPTKDKPDEPKGKAAGEPDNQQQLVSTKKDLLKTISADDYDPESSDYEKEGKLIDKLRALGDDETANEFEDVMAAYNEMDDDADEKFDDFKDRIKGKVPATEIAINNFNKVKNVYADQNYSELRDYKKDSINYLKSLQKVMDAGVGYNQGAAGTYPGGLRKDQIEALKDGMEVFQDKNFQLQDDMYFDEADPDSDILDNIEASMDFLLDDNADHDSYTKAGKVTGMIDDMIDDLKQLGGQTGELRGKEESYDGFARLEKFKRKYLYEKEEEIITDDDLIKDPSLEDVIKQDMKKKKKLDKKKSEIKVNPEMDIGVFSGGRKVPNGNLH